MKSELSSFKCLVLNIPCSGFPVLDFASAMASSTTAPLSPIDQLMPRTYTRIFLIFKVADGSGAVNRLSAGLAVLGTRLPYLRGRISMSKALADGNRLAITWSEANDPPLSLKEIAPPPHMPSFADLQRTGAPLHHFVNDLAPLGVLAPQTDAAVFAASYTPLAGGLLVCYCVHHAAMDGAGVADLARFWAESVRGAADSIFAGPDEPVHRLQRLHRAVAAAEIEQRPPGSPPPFADLLAKHTQYRLLSAARVPDPETPAAPPPPTSTSRLIRFSAAKLDRLRDVLAAATGASRETLSLNSLLSALVWSCVTRVRRARRRRGEPNGGDTSSSRLGFAVDGRRRLGADFAPGRYLGNVNLYTVADADTATLEAASTLSSDQLLAPLTETAAAAGAAASSFGVVAAAVAAAVGRITAPQIGEVLSLVEQAPDVEDVGPGWQSFHGPDLSMTSWAGQGFYEVDFGSEVGCPQFVRVPMAQFDGLVIVLPRRRGGDEKIETVCYLAEEDVDTLEADAVWSSWF